MDESVFQSLVVASLEEAGYDVDFVESKITCPGIPDLNLCKDGIDMWLELKVIRKGSTLVHIRPTQYAWFRKRAKKRSNAKMMILDCNTGLIYLLRADSVQGVKTLLDVKSKNPTVFDLTKSIKDYINT